MTPPDFKIFLEYQLRIITVWPGTYFPEEDITICHCPRKKYCPSPAKHPMYSKWYDTTPPENTSTTISQIENSNCNFAIVTGVLPNNPEKQLVIIDIDDIPRNMEFISKLPRTVTISTPRDGLHFYYILPSTIPVKNLSTGFVDLRGERGYALCPPSKHYRFVPTSLSTITELLELPPIPSNPSTSRSKSFNSSTGINYPNGTENSSTGFTDVTEDGLVAIGGRDSFVFQTLINLVNAGHSLNSLLAQADSIYYALEQPPKKPYTLSEIRRKAYYVHEKYSDPATEELRAAVDAF